LIVVDTNIIAHLYLSSRHSPQAELVLQKDCEWAAPTLWRSEFRNVLALYLRKALVDVPTAWTIMDAAEARMSGFEYEVISSEVLQLAAQSGCSAYDCEFVALAKNLGVQLVTVDNQVLTQFPESAVSPEKFLMH